MKEKEKIYIAVIIILIVLLVWFWKNSQSSDAISTLGKRVFNSGAVVVFAPNVKDIGKSQVLSIIDEKPIPSCKEWKEGPVKKNKVSTKSSRRNECPVKIIEVDGNVKVLKKNGDIIDPTHVFRQTIVQHPGSICWTFKNGTQYTRCYEEADVIAWCNANNNGHPICNLV